MFDDDRGRVCAEGVGLPKPVDALSAKRGTASSSSQRDGVGKGESFRVHRARRLAIGYPELSHRPREFEQGMFTKG